MFDHNQQCSSNQKIFFRNVVAATLLVAAISILTFPANAAGNQHAVGGIAGSLSINQGVTSYSIPIAVPPGVAGMKPSLALEYSNRGGNGSIGIGFSLSGLSEIGRCAKTVAQDGVRGRVQFNEDDRFCLDGQRLIAINGEYGGNGTEYRTEIDGASRIVSYGEAGSGPEKFKVWTKAGQILEYGYTEDARVVAAKRVTVKEGTVRLWAVNRILDTVGNAIITIYHKNEISGEHYPLQIDYAGNTIRFNYEQRPDKRVAYILGSRIQNDKRLASIESYAQGTTPESLMARYQLEYDQAQGYDDGKFQGSSRLIRVTQYDHDGNALPPTEFDWSDGKTRFSNLELAIPANFGGYTDHLVSKSDEHGERAMFMDINGDGLADRVEDHNTALDKPGFWVALNNGQDFDPLADWTPPDWEYFANFRLVQRDGDVTTASFMDMNGDGLPDRVSSRSYDGREGLWIGLNTGHGFRASVNWLSDLPYFYGSSATPFSGAVPRYEVASPVASLIDLNGDGLPDRIDNQLSVVGAYLPHIPLPGMWVALNTGTSFTAWKNWEPENWSGTYERWIDNEESGFADINGDGLPDRLDRDYGGHVGFWVALNNGNGFEPVTNWTPSRWDGDPRRKIKQIDNGGLWRGFMDINGDGLTDRVEHWNESTRQLGIWVSLNDGDRHFKPLENWDPGTWSGHADRPLNHEKAGFMDFNGDGLPDRYEATSNGTSRLWIALNTGTGFTGLQQWDPSGFAGDHFRDFNSNDGYSGFVDINGDGLPDRIEHNNSNQTATHGLWVAYNRSRQSELVGIRSGLGEETRISYATLADKAVYEATAELGDREALLRSPMRVVASTDTSNGVGGFNRVSYRYGGAKFQRDGRGLLGFAWDKATDEVTGNSTYTEYRQDFPFAGTPWRVSNRLKSGLLISRTETTLAANEVSLRSVPLPDGTQWTYRTFMPYPAVTVEKTYELNGRLVSETTTTQSEHDAYGNVGRVEVVTSAGETYKTITTNQYNNIVDDQRWFLGRLTATQVTHVHHNGSTAVRNSAFSYYEGTHGLLHQEIIEPNNPTVGVTQTTTYEYDGFGNQTQVTVSGSSTSGSSQSRTTTTRYTSDGRFISTITNALGHAETHSYDDRFGELTRLVGPNGLTTQWTYDGFGRKLREDRADGTATEWSRERVAKGDGFAPKLAVYTITKQELAGGGAQSLPPTIQYHDLLGRVLSTVTTGFDGTWVFQDTIYDAQGREVRSSLPYFRGKHSYWVDTHYDALNRVLQKSAETDRQVLITDFEYNGRETTEINSLDQRKVTLKDAKGRIALVTEEEGGRVTYLYDAVGNLLRTRQGAGGKDAVTNMSYDQRGRKVSMDDADMGHWTYGYNSFGELEWQVDAEGNRTEMVYDALGRMVQRNDIAAGKPAKTTHWVYDKAAGGKGKLARVTGPEPGYVRELSYDAFGRAAGARVSVDDKQFDASTEYDKFGRVATSTQPEGLVIENQYNDYGYLVARRSPVSGVNGFDPKHLENLLDETLDNAEQALTAATDYSEQAAWYRDKANAYEAIIDDAIIVPYDGTTQGSQCDPNNNAFQTWDLVDESPDLSGKKFPLLNDSQDVEYLQVPKGLAIIHGHVAVPVVFAPERFYRLIFDTGANRWDLEPIDAESWSRDIQPGLLDQQRRIAFGDFDNNGIRDYRRLDANGVEIPHPRDDGAACIDQQLYDELVSAAASGRSAAEVLESQAGSATALARDLIQVAANLEARARQAELWASGSGGSDLQALIGDDGYITFWRAQHRDASGRLSSVRTGNGLLTTRDYDPSTGHLNSILTGLDYGGLIRHLEYQYDALDNVLARQDLVQKVTESFQYDELNRLTQSRLDGTLYGVPYKESTEYRYDALGNITYKSDIGDYLYGNNGRTKYNAGPHAVIRAGDRGSYRYNKVGNLVEGGGRTIDWSSFNKPVKITKGDSSVSFSYGPDHVRYKKIAHRKDGSDETTWYFGKSYERTEKPGGGVTHKYFVQGDDGVAAIFVRHQPADEIDPSADEVRYLHRDALGSVDTITDGLGVVVQRTSYEPFGARRGGDWTSKLAGIELYTNRGFTGHEHIDEVGIIHMNGRVYDPELGRFLSADPNVQSVSSSQSYNRYSYVMNNPLKYTDPSGYFFKKLWRAIEKTSKFIYRISPDHQLFKFLARSQLAATIVQIGVSFIPGVGPFLSVAIHAGLAVGITYEATGSFKTALKAGLVAGVTNFVANSDAFDFIEFGDGLFPNLVETQIRSGLQKGLLAATNKRDFGKAFRRGAWEGARQFFADKAFSRLGGNTNKDTKPAQKSLNTDMASSLNPIHLLKSIFNGDRIRKYLTPKLRTWFIEPTKAALRYSVRSTIATGDIHQGLLDGYTNEFGRGTYIPLWSDIKKNDLTPYKERLVDAAEDSALYKWIKGVFD